MVPPPPAFTTDARTEETLNARDPAPSYQAEYNNDIWVRWTAVDRASRRVSEIQVKLDALEPELRSQSQELERMKEKSSNLFDSLHGKTRSYMPNALKRIHVGSNPKRRESKDLLRQNFEAAHREETSTMSKLETLRERNNSLNTQMQKNIRLASEADQVFELLGAYVSSIIMNSPESVIAAEQGYAETSSTYDMAQTLVADLLRARVTVQHAHHYYHNALKIIDAVRGTALGRSAFGGFGEVSKNRDYQAAAETAGKAQVCFNETVRVLTPHLSIIPEDIIPDFQKLKELGLLQATKMYGLMYGWKTSSGDDVGKSMKLLLQRQETAFACLTRLAVWVQNQVPIAETDLRDARSSRDQARRDLVAAWKVHIMPESVPMPSP